MDAQVAPWVWVAFVGGVAVLLVVDVAVIHRRARELTIREAALQSAAWIALGVGFGGLLLAWQGGEVAGEYFAAYLVEKSLSIDNVFLWALIFAHFAVPVRFQHRVLFWGIFGAIVLRGLFIFAGVAALERFHWVIYVFGGFLLLSALRLVVNGDGERVNPNRHVLGRFVHGWEPPIAELPGPYFVMRRDGRLIVTPLLAVLFLIETSDVVFAVDSIPAALGVSQDQFVVFTSNVLAILGLRALYFLLAAFDARLAYLRQGMAVILGFVGIKMVLTDVAEIPIALSLSVIAMILTLAVLASLRQQAPDGSWLHRLPRVPPARPG